MNLSELKDRALNVGGIAVFTLIALPFVAFIFAAVLTPEILK